jgi:hypothetical protein
MKAQDAMRTEHAHTVTSVVGHPRRVDPGRFSPDREAPVSVSDRERPALPVLWQLEVSHHVEKVRWALDYKHVPHIRRSLLAGRHALEAKS